MTMITEVFGVRGEAGDLILYPKLLAVQFDDEHKASVTTPFAGRTFTIVYENKNGRDFGGYIIDSAYCDEKEIPVNEDSFVVLSRDMLDALSAGAHTIVIHLS